MARHFVYVQPCTADLCGSSVAFEWSWGQDKSRRKLSCARTRRYLLCFGGLDLLLLVDNGVAFGLLFLFLLLLLR